MKLTKHYKNGGVNPNKIFEVLCDSNFDTLGEGIKNLNNGTLETYDGILIWVGVTYLYEYIEQGCVKYAFDYKELLSPYKLNQFLDVKKQDVPIFKCENWVQAFINGIFKNVSILVSETDIDDIKKLDALDYDYIIFLHKSKYDSFKIQKTKITTYNLESDILISFRFDIDYDDTINPDILNRCLKIDKILNH